MRGRAEVLCAVTGDEAGSLQSSLKLGLGKADGTLSLLPLSTLFEKLDALKTFQNGALSSNGAGGLQ